MPAGQELTQPMFIQSTNQTADAQVTQVSTDWAQPETFSPHTHNTHTSPCDADRCHRLRQQTSNSKHCSCRRVTCNVITLFFSNKCIALDEKKQRDTDWLLVKLHPCTNTIYASTATAPDNSLSADQLYSSSHSCIKKVSISVYTTCSWHICGWSEPWDSLPFLPRTHESYPLYCPSCSWRWNEAIYLRFHVLQQVNHKGSKEEVIRFNNNFM